MVRQGWVPERYDERDQPYRFQGDANNVRDFVSLPDDDANGFEAIYDQLNTESCVANATAAAYRLAAYKAKLQAPCVTDPSRLFIYWNARALQEMAQGTPMPASLPDDGSQNRNALKGLNVFGTCPEASWPFQQILGSDNKPTRDIAHVSERPSLKAYQDATHGRILEYCRLDPDHSPAVEQTMTDAQKAAVGVTTLGLLKECLNEGYPVVFGFWYFWPSLPLNQDPSDGKWVLDEIPVDRRHKGPDPNRNDGGHTVLCVGFDEAKQRVLIQNSWGADEKTHTHGRFWMPYSWIMDWEATDDFWMLRFIDTKAPAELEKRIVDQVS